MEILEVAFVLEYASRGRKSISWGKSY